MDAQSPINVGRPIPGCPWAFANDMRKMVNNKDYSNIKFVVGSSRSLIYGNSCILSARSQVFKAMFENEDGLHSACLEEPILLPDIFPNTFLRLLEFLYTNCCSLDEKNVVDVLHSAAEYSLDELQRICGQFMADCLSLSNACAAMQVRLTTILELRVMWLQHFNHTSNGELVNSLPNVVGFLRVFFFPVTGKLVEWVGQMLEKVSVMYNLPNLKDAVLDFIEKQTERVFKTEGFHELSDEALATLLASDSLDIEEIDLIGFVRHWATVNSVALGKPVKELTKNVAPHLRLQLLTTEELALVESENEKDSLIPVKMISDAWKYHALKSSSASPKEHVVRPRSGTKTKSRGR